MKEALVRSKTTYLPSIPESIQNSWISYSFAKPGYSPYNTITGDLENKFSELFFTFLLVFRSTVFSKQPWFPLFNNEGILWNGLAAWHLFGGVILGDVRTKGKPRVSHVLKGFEVGPMRRERCHFEGGARLGGYFPGRGIGWKGTYGKGLCNWWLICRVWFGGTKVIYVLG